MDCSMSSFPVHHQLPELAYTHVHQRVDATQTSHPLSSPSSLPSIFPSIRVFSSESVLHIRWPKHWSFSFNSTNINMYSDHFALCWEKNGEVGNVPIFRCWFWDSDRYCLYRTKCSIYNTIIMKVNTRKKKGFLNKNFNCSDGNSQRRTDQQGQKWASLSCFWT